MSQITTNGRVFTLRFWWRNSMGDAAMLQGTAQRAAGIDEASMLGALPAPCAPHAELPDHPLNHAPCLGNLFRGALREVLLAKLLAGAEEHDVVWLCFVLLFLRDVFLVLGLADVENVLFILGAFRFLAALALFLVCVRRWPFAGNVLRHKRIKRHRLGPQEFAPEAGKLHIEDGDLFRPGDDGSPRRVIDVLVTTDVDRRGRFQQCKNLPRADRQSGVAQATPERQQVGADQLRVHRRQFAQGIDGGER